MFSWEETKMCVTVQVLKKWILSYLIRTSKLGMLLYFLQSKKQMSGRSLMM